MTEPEIPDDAPGPEAGSGGPAPGAEVAGAETYRVLARKYRPATFAELIGQEALVRTLTNALKSGRLAHAYILTGVRGVGKTTTARIIARALNCIGADGAGGPTPEPCGVCEHCRAIAEDRHVDVIEMDAASRAGVEEIRELTDGVRYRPVSARYKIYIIDEVHMLSRPAFNALLKTLEEPPEHVVFVFATTEVRKVPVTVLSRCQRFDLRRVERETLSDHLSRIAGKEGARLAPAALALIARAADGSVRDGLSLLDQAIADAGAGADDEIAADRVRDMLGLADRAQILDLFDFVMKGQIKNGLELVARMYRAGAEPQIVLQDLLDLAHWLTRLKIGPAAAEGLAVSEAERARAAAMAEGLAMPVLTRAWQMLLKGLGEVQASPSALTALEMVLVRLAYAAELPTPAEIVARLDGAAAEPSPSPAPGRESADSAAGPGQAPGPAPAAETAPPMASGGPRAAAAAQPEIALASETEPDPAPAVTAPEPRSFEDVVALFAERREGLLHGHLVNHVHLVRFEPGRIEFRPAEGAPTSLANRLGEILSEWTESRWVVSVSGEPGAPTLSQQKAAAERAVREEAARDPLVRAVLDTFPGAEVAAVRARGEDGEGQ